MACMSAAFLHPPFMLPHQAVLTSLHAWAYVLTTLLLHDHVAQMTYSLQVLLNPLHSGLCRAPACSALAPDLPWLQMSACAAESLAQARTKAYADVFMSLG